MEQRVEVETLCESRDALRPDARVVVEAQDLEVGGAPILERRGQPLAGARAQAAVDQLELDAVRQERQRDLRQVLRARIADIAAPETEAAQARVALRREDLRVDAAGFGHQRRREDTNPIALRVHWSREHHLFRWERRVILCVFFEQLDDEIGLRSDGQSALARQRADQLQQVVPFWSTDRGVAVRGASAHQWR